MLNSLIYETSHKNKIPIKFSIKSTMRQLKEIKQQKKGLIDLKRSKLGDESALKELSDIEGTYNHKLHELNQEIVRLKTLQFSIAGHHLNILEAKEVFNKIEAISIKPLRQILKSQKLKLKIAKKELAELKLYTGITVTPLEVSIKENEVNKKQIEINESMCKAREDKIATMIYGLPLINGKHTVYNTSEELYTNFIKHLDDFSKFDFIKAPSTGKDYLDYIESLEKCATTGIGTKHKYSEQIQKYLDRFIEITSEQANNSKLITLGFKEIDLALLNNDSTNVLNMVSNFNEVDFFKIADFYRSVGISWKKYFSDKAKYDYARYDFTKQILNFGDFVDPYKTFIGAQILLPPIISMIIKKSVHSPKVEYWDETPKPDDDLWNTSSSSDIDWMGDLDTNGDIIEVATTITQLSKSEQNKDKLSLFALKDLCYIYRNTNQKAQTLAILISDIGLTTANYKDASLEFDTLKDFDIRIAIGPGNVKLTMSNLSTILKKINQEYQDLSFVFIKIANHGSKNNPILEPIIKEASKILSHNTLIYPIQCYGGQYDLEKIIDLTSINNNLVLITASSAQEPTYHPYEYNCLKANKSLYYNDIKMATFIRFIIDSNHKSTGYISGVLDKEIIPHQALKGFYDKCLDEQIILYPEKTFVTPLDDHSNDHKNIIGIIEDTLQSS